MIRFEFLYTAFDYEKCYPSCIHVGLRIQVNSLQTSEDYVSLSNTVIYTKALSKYIKLSNKTKYTDHFLKVYCYKTTCFSEMIH